MCIRARRSSRTEAARMSTPGCRTPLSWLWRMPQDRMLHPAIHPPPFFRFPSVQLRRAASPELVVMRACCVRPKARVDAVTCFGDLQACTLHNYVMAHTSACLPISRLAAASLQPFTMPPCCHASLPYARRTASLTRQLALLAASLL